jgi:hypothetical protein
MHACVRACVRAMQNRVTSWQASSAQPLRHHAPPPPSGSRLQRLLGANVLSSPLSTVHLLDVERDAGSHESSTHFSGPSTQHGAGGAAPRGHACMDPGDPGGPRSQHAAGSPLDPSYGPASLSGAGLGPGPSPLLHSGRGPASLSGAPGAALAAPCVMQDGGGHPAGSEGTSLGVALAAAAAAARSRPASGAGGQPAPHYHSGGLPGLGTRGAGHLKGLLNLISNGPAYSGNARPGPAAPSSCSGPADGRAHSWAVQGAPQDPGVLANRCARACVQGFGPLIGVLAIDH